MGVDRCPHCGGRYKTWTPEKILDAVRRWVDTHGEPPAADDWRCGTPEHPSASTAWKAFGTWRQVILAAGFEPRPAHRPSQVKWDRETAKTAIYRWRYETGRLPKFNQWARCTETHPSARQLIRMFGSWNAAIVEAGYEPVNPTRSKSAYRAQGRMRDEQGRMVAA
jgi:hypothetical protein